MKALAETLARFHDQGEFELLGCFFLFVFLNKYTEVMDGGELTYNVSCTQILYYQLLLFFFFIYI